jgi:hypothetical protein
MQAKFYDPNKQEDDFKITIDRNGQWFHDGAPISRKRLAQLFSTALHYDPKTNEYWLITPQEQGRITVEDTAFVINDFTWNGHELSLTSNLKHQISPNAHAPFFLKNSMLYCHVENNIPTRINRTVREKLINIALEQPHNKHYNGEQILTLKANNHDHPIACA